MKSEHGIYIARMSRNHPEYGGGQYSATPDRSQMYAQVGIVTTSFNFPAMITLTPAEVKIINNLEARIAKRLSNEIEVGGIHE